MLIRIIALQRLNGNLNLKKDTKHFANSSSCTVTDLSIRFTSGPTAIKKHAIKYCEIHVL